jgi:hypothetical protein
MKNVLLAIARYLYGLFYAGIGAIGAYRVLTDPNAEWPAFNDAEIALTQALTAAGFFVPIVILTCLTGGILLLFKRTAPVGLLVLTPLVGVIFLYHAYLTGAYVHAVPQVIYLGALYWFYRDAFVPLWNYGRSNAR